MVPRQDEDDDPFEWHPATVQMEIEHTFGIDLPAASYDRLMTAISLLTTNSFFNSPVDYTRACVVLSGHEVTPQTLMLPDAADLAWGTTEALLISPPDDKDENPFVPEITAYIGMVLDSEGILNPPDILRIATRDNELVNRVNYEYSDDPEMFGAIHQMEGSKTDDINRVIRGRMIALAQQLQALPLRHGKLEELAQRMLANLPGDEPLPLPV